MQLLQIYYIGLDNKKWFIEYMNIKNFGIKIKKCKLLFFYFKLYLI